MSERGVIRNREFAQQIRDFSGLRFGKITPTDIDAFLDFGDRLFVIIEGKHAGATLPHGQQLAIARLVDACHCPPRRIATAIIVDHYGSGDIDYAVCSVRAYRWAGVWRNPLRKRMQLREAVDRMKAMSERMLRPDLRIVKGGR